MTFLSSIIISLLLSPSVVEGKFPLTRLPQNSNTRKAKYLSEVLNKAKPLRKLDEDEQEVDLSGYSLKYEKCQLIKQWSSDEDGDNNNGGDGDYDDILSLNKFAVFRLCPSDGYSSCNSNYGEYIIDLEDYLLATTNYFLEKQEDMCDYCDEICNADDDAVADDSVDCDSCVDECDKIENMEDNGYLEASNYIECVQLEQDNDDDGDDQPVYYGAATCSTDGSKIKIGVYQDENCAYVNTNLSVDDYLQGFKLSHALLKNVYSGSNIPCSSYDEDGDEEEDEACQELYEDAAKCESYNGFAGTDYYSANQAANEEVVCDFISQIKKGTYDASSGEIVLQGNGKVVGGGSSATGGQKFALTVLVLGTIGLAVYAASIHSSLTQGAKADLSKQGGQMA